MARRCFWGALVIALLGLPAPGVPAPPNEEAAAAALITALEGVYKRRFKSGVVVPGQPDEVMEVEDVLELVRHDARHLYFRAKLQFYNGHTCGLYGLARFEAGRFVYRAPTPASNGATCTLWIAADKSHVTLTDAPPNGSSTCQEFCGARGSFRDWRIERSKRRPIRYLPRLMASREYGEAVGEREKAEKN
jgi:hypothetical protein